MLHQKCSAGARTGHEVEFLRKASALGEQSVELKGGRAVEVDARNPACPRAIPYGTLVSV